MAVVRYTFTHNQYTEQHNETEYTEQNIITIIHKHNKKEYIKNNKNAYFTKLIRSIQNI